MQSYVACPACGTVEPTDGPTSLDEIATYTCDSCEARVVYGRLMPRLVVEPRTDERGFVWTRLRFQDRKTRSDVHVADLDPRLTALFARTILDLTLR